VTDGHPADALSALLDGELDPQDEAAVRSHLEGCSACAVEMDATARARHWLRSLPAVEPPAGFYPRVLEGGRWRRGAAACAAIAAAVAVVGLTRPQPETVRPAVPELVEVHAATASVAGDPVSELVPAVVPVTFRPQP
jgi:anti-sigma factor RsiW